MSVVTVPLSTKIDTLGSVEGEVIVPNRMSEKSSTVDSSCDVVSEKSGGFRFDELIRGPEMHIVGEVFGKEVSMLVDTGSMVSVVNSRLTSTMKDWLLPKSVRIHLADGSSTVATRGGTVFLTLAGNLIKQPMIELDTGEDVILGMDFLERNVQKLDLFQGRLMFNKVDLSVEVTGYQHCRQLVVDEEEVEE